MGGGGGGGWVRVREEGARKGRGVGNESGRWRRGRDGVGVDAGHSGGGEIGRG